MGTAALMPRTKQRTPELRDRVLAAALELLAERGAAGLTARSLAARAATSAPALYELFGDKSGVVRELYFEGFRQLGTHLAALAETADPVSDLWELATAYRRFVRSNRELAEVMFSAPSPISRRDPKSSQPPDRSASSSSAGYAGASKPVGCAATRPTWRTSSWR